MNSLIEMSATEKKLIAIDQIAANCDQYWRSKSFLSGVMLAQHMLEIKNLIDDNIMKSLLNLQGSQLGFFTDKDKEGGYPANIVRDVVIVALGKGLSIIGNEFNIIGGKFYMTKNGISRLLRDLDGFRDLKIKEGEITPSPSGQGAFVDMSATWTLNGQPDSLEITIPVKVNAGQGADAILGKATKKLLSRIHVRCTGSLQSTDSHDQDATDEAA